MFVIDGSTNTTFSMEVDSGAIQLVLPPDIMSGSAPLRTYGGVGGMLEGTFEAQGGGAMVFANFNVIRGRNR
jgi:hypothetical protein